MNLVISGKNLDITEGLRSAVEEKSRPPAEPEA